MVRLSVTTRILCTLQTTIRLLCTGFSAIARVIASLFTRLHLHNPIEAMLHASPFSMSADGSAGSRQEYGCEHYKRRCKLVSPCCGEVVWCRHCHNKMKSDEEQDPQKRHMLDRKAVKEIVCAVCSTAQPVSSACTSCGVSFGAYTCLKCNFFDDETEKQQFHCDDCGICRVGGRENFFHCRTCNCCYSISLRNTHECVENSMHQNCPVCFEYLFDSVKNIAVMKCGHTIHQECLKQLFDHHTYACPVCCRSTAEMDRMWDELDATVRSTPMPPEYRGMVVNILCNDCTTRSSGLKYPNIPHSGAWPDLVCICIHCFVNMPATCNPNMFWVDFHILGHKCRRCGSYNTRRI